MRYPDGAVLTLGFGRLDDDETIFDDTIQTVEVKAFAGRKVTQLSGGQHQRAFIVRALATRRTCSC
ncbi:hypothetical protein [Halobaculum sp. MBLA0143]|uniref:hypothetical protein n=1 Tax=Halobaculum sp. MBLA0143 TaxID=3079933 RepID=UPI003524C59F